MAKPSIDFAHIKRVVPLEAVLARYGLLDQLKRSGRQLRGCCPIHRGSNRNFSVNLGTHEWRCFGDCDRGGSTLELVAEMERVDVRQAAQLIAAWFAIPLSPAPAARSPTTARARRHPMSDKPTHKAFVTEEYQAGREMKTQYTEVGSAWPHKNGKGFNIVLRPGLAVVGRLVLFEYEEKKDDEASAARPK